MGCDIHFSVEIVSKHYYRKKRVNKLLEKDDKLSFKEFLNQENNVPKWEAYYIDWFKYVNPNNLDEDNGDGEYISEKENFYKFIELGYKNNPDIKVEIYQDYDLFALLANVRGVNENCISQDRGLPEDVTDAVKYYHDVIWEYDSHSTSWISLKELINFGKSYLDNEVGEYFWLNIIEPLKNLNLSYDDVRLVFWFDN